MRSSWLWRGAVGLAAVSSSAAVKSRRTVVTLPPESADVTAHPLVSASDIYLQLGAKTAFRYLSLVDLAPQQNTTVLIARDGSYPDSALAPTTVILPPLRPDGPPATPPPTGCLKCSPGVDGRPPIQARSWQPATELDRASATRSPRSAPSSNLAVLRRGSELYLVGGLRVILRLQTNTSSLLESMGDAPTHHVDPQAVQSIAGGPRGQHPGCTERRRHITSADAPSCEYDSHFSIVDFQDQVLLYARANLHPRSGGRYLQVARGPHGASRLGPFQVRAASSLLTNSPTLLIHPLQTSPHLTSPLPAALDRRLLALPRRVPLLQHLHLVCGQQPR